MPVNKSPWWHDPKFIIPGILVPVAVAMIGLSPSLIPEKTSEELSVSLSISDPRRTDSGLYDMRLTKTFSIDAKVEAEAAINIANSLAKEIISNHSTLHSNRKMIRLLVQSADDGTLFIDERWNKSVAIHLSRFTDSGDIGSIAVAAANFRRGAQRTLNDPYLPTEYFSGEISVHERKMRAGVYRLVFTAPGYRDQSIYLQLSEKGKVFTASDYDQVTELTFPFPVKLFPRFRQSTQPAPLRVAVGTCKFTQPLSAKPKFQNIGLAIQMELVSALRQSGLESFILAEGQKTGFDLNPSKGLPPTEGIVAADIAIDLLSCEWL